MYYIYICIIYIYMYYIYMYYIYIYIVPGTKDEWPKTSREAVVVKLLETGMSENRTALNPLPTMWGGVKAHFQTSPYNEDIIGI